ncbi:hypothetical protein I3760_14G043600 [Carya illinoinensis]|nr:hypothetical protein I3760_14G043600 [Carya illinoinensis]
MDVIHGVKVNNYLLSQGLWNIVETSSEPPKPNDDVLEFEAWGKKNDMALHAIQSSWLGRDDYAALLKAVRRGDWNSTREFLELHPGAWTSRITCAGGTVLHAAVGAEHEHMVEELVNMIWEHDLATMQDHSGDTALHETAISGNYGMVECLIRKNKSLVNVRNANGELPVTSAMSFGHIELARYLYSLTPFEDLEAAQDRQGASLLKNSIDNGDIDMALDLMERCPRLAFALDIHDVSPLEVLADAFESGNYGMVFWKQWTYNHFSSLLNLLGFKRFYEMKLIRLQFQQFLSRMCEAVPTNTSQYETIAPVIFRAISRGNFEFVYHIVKANLDLLRITNDKGRSIFHWAVLHHQHRIFSLIYSLKKKNALLSAINDCNNIILHMAGMLTEHTPIDSIRGAALQMQREIQCFKEVECICPLFCKERLNKDGLTPKQLFTTTHQKLKERGEEWMKVTATSSTVVGALIITITFAAAFTIPSGNNPDTSLPILVDNKLFKIFVVTNTMSLFSSTTSVLAFLEILTARYAEEAFLTSLTRRMIIGLFTLFFSITTLMIAFSTALLLILRGKIWFVAPIIGLASVPIILFALMQFHLVVDMVVSTYGSGIFNRTMKAWL